MENLDIQNNINDTEDTILDGLEIYKLKRPIKFDGQKIKELKMDFESLTANDLLRCEKEAKIRLGKKEQMLVPETNKLYNACVAAKAAGIRTEVMLNLSAKDFTQVCLLSQNFLLDGDSEEEDFLS